MAAVARDNCAGLAVEIVEDDFEHWPIREGFGALLSVQSWHWIDHDLRYPIAAGGDQTGHWHTRRLVLTAVQGVGVLGNASEALITAGLSRPGGERERRPVAPLPDHLLGVRVQEDIVNPPGSACG